MNYLRVKNWSEFQHYKDRNPPWIKLHRALLDDYEFSRLQDASKSHLMLIWLFASTQKDGRIPNDPAFLKKRLGLEKEPDLKRFIDQGLLLTEQSASTKPEQNASNVLSLARSRETETEERQRRGEESNAADASRRPLEASKRIVFNFELSRFEGITEQDELRWQEAYPAVPIPPAIERAAAWLHANPANRKSNYERFLVNWFAREQDRAPRVAK